LRSDVGERWSAYGGITYGAFKQCCYQDVRCELELVLGCGWREMMSGYVTLHRELSVRGEFTKLSTESLRWRVDRGSNPPSCKIKMMQNNLDWWVLCTGSSERIDTYSINYVVIVVVSPDLFYNTMLTAASPVAKTAFDVLQAK
jgi:hypothetical protein